MTASKYNDAAQRAVVAHLTPATNEETAKRWKELGVSRQTGWLWSRDGNAPLAARLAVAWFIHSAGNGDA